MSEDERQLKMNTLHCDDVWHEHDDEPVKTLLLLRQMRQGVPLGCHDRGYPRGGLRAASASLRGAHVLVVERNAARG
jgi:hypothetical protein